MPKIIRRTVSSTRLIPPAAVIAPTPVVSVVKEEVVIVDGALNHPVQIVETSLPVVVVEQQERLVKLV